MSTDALKTLAAKLAGDNPVQCKFAVRDAVADHGAVILEIKTDDCDVIGLPLTREVAEEIARQLVMPFLRYHLAILLSECDDPQPNDEGDDQAHKPH